MQIKLGDSELKVMHVLWDEGDTTAKHISAVMTDKYGWNINTTYSLLKRCIKKGAVQRYEPNFMCHALVSREEIQKQETANFLEKFFDGSTDKLFSALLGQKNLSRSRVEKIEQLISELESDELE
ncbi:MAG: BlaI/MecI/CopY family transcriptional regulator [Lachnospiraceae bacterium]